MGNAGNRFCGMKLAGGETFVGRAIRGRSSAPHSENRCFSPCETSVVSIIIHRPVTLASPVRRATNQAENGDTR